MVIRFASADLIRFATRLLVAGGLAEDRARDVAEVLVEGDLLGHTTHGLGLLPKYLEELRDGRMERVGEPHVVADHGSALTWDGRYLPGPWLVRRAIAEACARVREHPLVTVVIGRSHHIACLQAFLKPVADDGLMMILTCTDPSGRWVAPPGSVEAVYSPNPIAVAIPTDGDPVLIDISTSTTAVAVCWRAVANGQRLPGPWLIDASGRPTDDPTPFIERKSGAMFPLGGPDLGYKGFAFGLLLEALTSGLAGHGRASHEARWGASVCLMLVDPARFGGRDAFVRETSFLFDACRAAAVPPGHPGVRLPGDSALAKRRDQRANGVALHPDVMPALLPWARDLNVPSPAALD
jgi:LDH2 family malate/lactate/ureidoglycolate dehydrogenase